MNHQLFEDVYETMRDEMIPEYKAPGVENAFASGEVCDRAYHELREAYSRLCARLDVQDEDVEAIICAGLVIQKELCRRMFLLGMKYGECNK